MKKLLLTLIIPSLVSIAVPALAAKAGGAANLGDRAAIAQLSMLEARKTMLGLCGVTGDEAAKDLAGDNEKAAKYQAQLSDDGKKSLPDAMAKIDDGVKKSWDTTPEADRTKSCEALKSRMSAGK